MDGAKPDGRRTETRDRINQVALDVFIERGYDGATLREIADRLGVTRPALYYHVKNKEELLTGIHQELAESLDPIIDAAVDAGPGSSTRADLVTRMAGPIDGRWGRFTSFAQANEAAMRTLTAAAAFRERMEVLTVILAPTDDIEGRMRARLALDVLFMASARDRQLGGTHRERMKIALSMALRLVADRPPASHRSIQLVDDSRSARSGDMTKTPALVAAGSRRNDGNGNVACGSVAATGLMQVPARRPRPPQIRSVDPQALKPGEPRES